jgi:hypothetical protein
LRLLARDAIFLHLLDPDLYTVYYFLQPCTIVCFAQGVRRALAEKLYQWDSQLEAILLGYERAKLRVQQEQEQGAAEGPRNIITLKEKFTVHHCFSDRHL